MSTFLFINKHCVMFVLYERKFTIVYCLCIYVIFILPAVSKFVFKYFSHTPSLSLALFLFLSFGHHKRLLCGKKMFSYLTNMTDSATDHNMMITICLGRHSIITSHMSCVCISNNKTLTLCVGSQVYQTNIKKKEIDVRFFVLH